MESPVEYALMLLERDKPLEAIDLLARVPLSPYYMHAREWLSRICARVRYCPGDPTPAGGEVSIHIGKVVRRYPHPYGSFTQGITYMSDTIIESVGLVGKSALVQYDLASGRVMQRRSIPHDQFAEGVARVHDEIFQLTWTNEVGYIYDAADLSPKGTFRISGEGWGLATTGSYLILSNGTNRLRFLDPETFAVNQTLEVENDGVPLMNLNELEVVRGELWANVWLTDRIARIDLTSGKLIGWLELEGLLPSRERLRADVLNGIAYDSASDRVLVTGKKWPAVFEIDLVPVSPTHRGVAAT